MNIQQAQKLADIANYIRPIKKCNKSHGIGTSSHIPGCLMCNAVRGGLIEVSENRNRFDLDSVDFSNGFAAYFSVTEREAGAVLYHNHLISGDKTTGENYYTACKALLVKYGYAHLLQTPGAEYCKQFLREGIAVQSQDNLQEFVSRDLPKYYDSII